MLKFMYRCFSILVVAFLLAACGSIGFSAAPQSQPKPTAISRLITSAPKPSQTITPFQPLAPTPTFTATFTPTQTFTPLPTNTPVPVVYTGSIPKAEGRVNILVFGSDARPGGGFRTDVVLLVSINPDTASVSVVSFPRDLYIYIPGWGQDRINIIMGIFGWSTMVAAFEYNFGIHPDYYVLTNMTGFKDIIDTMGGILVNCASNLTDKCDLHGSGYCSVGPGKVEMGGDYALWYVRSRYSTSDLDRTRRAQEVLKALFIRMIGLDAISNIPKFYEIYTKNVTHNLDLGAVLSLIPTAARVAENGNIRSYLIGPNEVWNYTVPATGAMVLVPDMNAVMAILAQAMAP
jgi:LCP family protein required for cell wall assembly